MSGTLQKFIAAATTKAANDLITALENLPEDKRGWSPLDKGRSALDQAAECAILNGFTGNLLKTKTFPKEFDYEAFTKQKVELAKDWNTLKSLLLANTEVVVEIMGTISDEDLEIPIEMPWGTFSLGQTLCYPYWNMAYHEGQTNYIGFLAG